MALTTQEGWYANKQRNEAHISVYIHIYIYIYIYISKLGDFSIASFSIATTPKCREGHNSFLWIALLYP